MPKNTKVFLLRTYCSFNFSSAHFNSYLWTNCPPLREETPSPLLSSLPGSEAQGHHSRHGDTPPNHRSVTLWASGDGYFRSPPPGCRCRTWGTRGLQGCPERAAPRNTPWGRGWRWGACCRWDRPCNAPPSALSRAGWDVRTERRSCLQRASL